MNLKQLINKSYYSSNGYIESLDSITQLEGYIMYNLPVLIEFKGHIIATTYKTQSSELIEANHNLWKKYFPKCVFIDIPENRGHSFGIADSENAIIDYCKENSIDWICKSSNDVIFNSSILNKSILEADFYYLNGIGYGGMGKYNFDNQRIIDEDFYPQTNFYFINVDKIDYLYDKNYVNETYNYIQDLENYNGKVWEYIEGWSCEDFLKNCVNRNNLSKYHLVSPEKYIILLETIKNYQIHDCSHKNIMVEGVCHLHYPEKEILIV